MKAAPESITLLLLSPDEGDGAAVRNIFRHPAWKVQCKHRLSEARGSFGTAAVILCERDLPDGTWKDVLRALRNHPDPPLLIVCSRAADELLWTEVLDLGAYDVLQKPFEVSEVTRVVSVAWRQRRNHANVTAMDLAAVHVGSLRNQGATPSA